MELINKKIIYDLKNEKPQQHIGEYFKIININNKYYLYYNCENKIKLIISDTLDFTKKTVEVILDNVPGGCFCIIKKEENYYMFCGNHISNKEINEIIIPDLVWPNEKRKILDWTVSRNDRKNGLYLLYSNNGIKWNNLYDKPIIHSYISSDSCKLGELGFDTNPRIIYYNNQYLFYSRLNSSLDERRLCVRKSNDLINWSLPEKIDIINENNNNLKKNYYNIVIFEKNNILYGLCPYFEACGTIQRKCVNGCTILLKSNDGLKWEIIEYFNYHEGKYKDRINEAIIHEDTIKIFYRENVIKLNQNFISYDLNIFFE